MVANSRVRQPHEIAQFNQFSGFGIDGSQLVDGLVDLDDLLRWRGNGEVAVVQVFQGPGPSLNVNSEPPSITCAGTMVN